MLSQKDRSTNDGPVESNLDNTKNTKITHVQNFSFIQTLMSLCLLLRSLKVTETTNSVLRTCSKQIQEERQNSLISYIQQKKIVEKAGSQISPNILSTSLT